VYTDENNARDIVETLLNDQSYHIEFNGFLTNHVKHAVVALNGLGASPKMIKEYYDSYAECTTYGYGLEPSRASEHTITQDNWKNYFGKHCNFTSYCQFFDQQERKLGMKRMLEEYLPSLLPGCVGALMHATIHMGWALNSGNRWMIIEGVAYMAFSYVSCRTEKNFPIPRDNTALESLLSLADAWNDDSEALRGWLESTLADEKYSASAGFHPELASTGAQFNIAKVLAEGHPLIYATPAWLESQDMPTIFEQMYEALTLLYMTKPGDFFILHLITSLFAMEQITKRLPVSQQKSAIKYYWTAILGVIFSIGEFPTRAKLETLHLQYKDTVDVDGDLAEGQEWDQIVSRALSEKEEHNPKLVYVMRLLWKRFGNRSIFRVAAGHFTTPPVVPKLESGETLSADIPC
jgi:hypothetical protein